MKLPGLLLLLSFSPAAAQEAEPVDEFHPDRETEVAPAYGGRVTVHLYGLPKSANYMLENSGYTRWMSYEFHEYLVQMDWETWEHRPRLCSSWDTEDTLVLKAKDDSGESERVFGKVSEEGDEYVVAPASSSNTLSAPKRFPKDEVESVELGTVLTFHLRENVKWQDGHPFDAHDVVFSYECYLNPGVDCDSSRPYFKRILSVEATDDHTVRFLFEEQYFRTLSTIDILFILPRHIYDLRDPDNPDHDPEATDEELAKHVNENPHNRVFVGLGPYQLKKYDQQVVEAERFADYFDPENAGYIDSIRWRHIPSEDTAYQALINGELDFTQRVKTDDYFGEGTAKPVFTDTFYKGYFYTAGFNYTPWNMRRPPFDDVRVRKAMAHAYDMEAMLETFFHGLGLLPTGPQFYFGNAYNKKVERLTYDLDKAEELLAEAGWYDRDGDGIIDKDGIPFEFDYMTTPGSATGRFQTQGMKENLEKLGIKMNLFAVEWATFLEHLYDRDYDAAGLAWILDVPESDPIQLWHSSGAKPGVRGSNHPGVDDPKVDEMIAKGNRELDPEKRWEIAHELHRYLYEEIQPYMYGVAPPRKFAMNKKIRGFQTFKIPPGYSLRRWYYPEGTPGTRSTRR